MGVGTSRTEDLDDFLRAIERGDMDDIQRYLSSGIKVDSATALYKAMESGHVDVVKLLINSGCDINKGIINESPLHHACQLGYVDIILELLSSGVDINRRDQYGMTAVWAMATAGNVNILRHLLQHPDVDVSLPSGDNSVPAVHSHTSPLIMAARQSHNAVADLLCQHHSNYVNFTDAQGRTALHYAACNGNDVMTSLLLERGAGIDCVDEDGVAPIYTASKHGHTTVVQKLLDSGANVSTPAVTCSTNSGFCPLHIAVFNGHFDVVRLFCDSSQSLVDVRTVSQKTPLILACYTGRRDIVLLLLKYGAEPNVKDSLHQTPLFYALSQELQAYNRNKVHSPCIDNNNDKDSKSHQTLNNNCQISQQCIGNGDPGIVDDDDDISVLEHLILFGADVSSLDVNQRSFWFYGIMKGTLSQCVVMMKYGAHIHPFKPITFSKMDNCDKLKALIQIDLRFREVARLCCCTRRLSPDLKRCLEEALANPPSLKVQCRHIIRNNLLSKKFGVLHKQTQELPIPKLLQWYILLNDVCNQFDISSKYT
ncbi:serine/threonine-protein phosphatase 6 regulatory ankyrin repeat subunit B-like isoform X2 [Argopecten irradians]|uniref:serine/threonine-protein phosphatase 6 regulatory ankyrin repeat subunit B-like isoform X2 n=1 Tax=Argopecten irradians TaxID=31199 RepID=UPI00371200F9